uniref:Sulfhydryl oxidase n=1 Tax=Varanus komodoensis TaxID=61221 RepID=A0A8D2IXM0_VARKO
MFTLWFPSFQFFKAFSKKPEDGIRLYHHGDNIQSLRESIIDSLESHKGELPPACPPLEPISTAGLHSFFQANRVTYLALIFEKEGSYLGREVALDMLNFKNVAVRRVLESNEELVKRFNVTAFPSAYLLFNNGSCSRIPVHVDARPAYTHYLRRLPGVVRGDSFRPTVLPTAGPSTTVAPWRLVDRKKVYMADVESAVVYTLRSEAARYPYLEKERLSALKQYVNVLTKYFPGRLMVMNFLLNLDFWLKSKTNISQSEWEEALRNKEELPNARLPEKTIWVGCQGSKPGFRGYPCSLWTLFHLLTVQEALLDPKTRRSPEALRAMRAYVRHFFGCRECAEHFEGMAAEDMDKVQHTDAAILWLWSRHNRVNARLAGKTSEDPRFPKIQWPPQELCWTCQMNINGQRIWNKASVLKFFKHHFSTRNIFLDFLEPRRVAPARNGRDVQDGVPGAAGEPAEGGGGEEQARTEKQESRRKKPGSERPGPADLHRPSIVRMSTKTKTLGEDIVDLDSFSEQHFKSKALKAAGQAGPRSRRSRRDTGVVLVPDEGHQSFDHDPVWEPRRHGGPKRTGAMEEPEAAAEGSLVPGRRSQWFHILGAGFSRLDVSLCIVLYLLSSLCLLAMYTFFRVRMKYHKSRLGLPSA